MIQSIFNLLGHTDQSVTPDQQQVAPGGVFGRLLQQAFGAGKAGGGSGSEHRNARHDDLSMAAGDADDAVSASDASDNLVGAGLSVIARDNPIAETLLATDAGISTPDSQPRQSPSAAYTVMSLSGDSGGSFTDAVHVPATAMGAVKADNTELVPLPNNPATRSGPATRPEVQGQMAYAIDLEDNQFDVSPTGDNRDLLANFVLEIDGIDRDLADTALASAIAEIVGQRLPENPPLRLVKDDATSTLKLVRTEPAGHAAQNGEASQTEPRLATVVPVVATESFEERVVSNTERHTQPTLRIGAETQHVGLDETAGDVEYQKGSPLPVKETGATNRAVIEIPSAPITPDQDLQPANAETNKPLTQSSGSSQQAAVVVDDAPKMSVRQLHPELRPIDHASQTEAHTEPADSSETDSTGTTVRATTVGDVQRMNAFVGAQPRDTDAATPNPDDIEIVADRAGRRAGGNAEVVESSSGDTRSVVENTHRAARHDAVNTDNEAPIAVYAEVAEPTDDQFTFSGSTSTSQHNIDEGQAAELRVLNANEISQTAGPALTASVITNVLAGAVRSSNGEPEQAHDQVAGAFVADEKLPDEDVAKTMGRRVELLLHEQLARSASSPTDRGAQTSYQNPETFTRNGSAGTQTHVERVAIDANAFTRDALGITSPESLEAKPDTQPTETNNIRNRKHVGSGDDYMLPSRKIEIAPAESDASMRNEVRAIQTEVPLAVEPTKPISLQAARSQTATTDITQQMSPVERMTQAEAPRRGDTAAIRIDDGDGNSTFVRVTVRGDQVRTSIIHPDQHAVTKLTAGSDQLHDALRSRGFQDTAVNIQAPKPASETATGQSTQGETGNGEHRDGRSTERDDRHDRRQEPRDPKHDRHQSDRRHDQRRDREQWENL